MTFHSKDGRFFLGVRTAFGGRSQVVVDEDGGRRTLIDLDLADGAEGLVTEALAAALNSRHPIERICAELQLRSVATRLVARPAATVCSSRASCRLIS
ncbi:MAG: hypothetical protein KGN33_15430 [Paracoccaceae bacterium]|nr:hypothetical protein [Paracoccaceae bacterium]